MRNAAKVHVWTECLGDGWEIRPGHRERVDRGLIALDDLAGYIRMVRDYAQEMANCLFVLRSSTHQLDVSLEQGNIIVSDPGNSQYQNIALSEEELNAFLEGYFRSDAEEETPESRHPRLLEWIVIGAGAVILILSALLIRHTVFDEAHFLPPPDAMKIENAADERTLIQQYAGLYATRIGDGEMLIELREDGTWAYFDMYGSQMVNFKLEPVNAGSFEAGFKAGQLAILTDARFVFTLNRERDLEFLQRRFRIVAQERKDIPYLVFPDEQEESSTASGKP